MVARRISRRALCIAAAVTIASVPAFFVLRFLVMTALEDVGLVGSRYVGAEYDEMSFGGTDKSHLSGFSTGESEFGKSTPVAPIFISFNDNDPVFLPEISEEDVGRRWDRNDTWGDNPEDHHYGKRGLCFLFRNGRLVSFTCGATGVRFGPTQDGPFLELPTNKKDLIRVFGRPKRWNHGRGKPHFF